MFDKVNVVRVNNNTKVVHQAPKVIAADTHYKQIMMQQLEAV